MPISINPVVPVIAAPGVAPDLVLQPGTVIDAQVLKILSNDLVRIAIANLAIDVLTEVPLSAGQALQLAVSQTPQGIRLAIVDQGSSAASASDSPSDDAVSLAPAALAGAADTAVAAGSPRIQLTPPERAAVAAAAESAATEQDSLAPLFANLDVIAGASGLPPQLQQAVLQVLAQRTDLDQNLTGSDIKNAFQQSGILLEASLASGSVASPVSTASGIPDLKAALIVLRQVLVASLGPAANSAPPAAPQQPLSPQPPILSQLLVAPETPAAPDAPSAPHPAAPAISAPFLFPEIDLHDVLLPQARVAVAEDSPVPNGGTVRIVLQSTLPNAGARATTGAALNLLQEVSQGFPQDTARALAATPASQRGPHEEVTVHTNTPPPPFRGALPSTQPIASPSIAPDAPLATNVRHLLDDTEAAIARQTLLQVASLPDTVDAIKGRLDPTALRWNFEIPFVTPQGTAVTQFEISRDGGSGSETAPGKRVWRVRFSIDIAPAGPIHAQVSLIGERTSVRMWAERPATVAQLRAGASQLSAALSKAELQPGEIVIRDGTPPQSGPARAGPFLDRAL